MAKTLEKARKVIFKKKGSGIDSLHEKSRNAKKLHRAQIRDDRLEKIARTRRRQDKPLRTCPLFLPNWSTLPCRTNSLPKVARAAFFQEFANENGNKPYELDAIQAKISE